MFAALCGLQSRLFKVVSFITGFKNSMKGIGYFLGAACLTFNYYFALGVLLVLVAAAMPWAVIGLSNDLGRWGQ
jgi:lipopolysaccharide export LptBFGC system permease protein LptF